MENHTILGGQVQLYRRGETRFWWCSTRIGGKQRRKTTGKDSLKLAEDVAKDWYLTLQGKMRDGVLDVGKTFAEAAKKFTLCLYGLAPVPDMTQNRTTSWC
jgi:hypothetical protein